MPADATAEDACARLIEAGWLMIGAGDWSRAFADPTGAWAARVTAFDPAYRLFAESCLAGPSNRWLPRIADLVPLRRDGYVVVMERLWPADEAAASAFCAALGIKNDSEDEPPVASPADPVDDAELGKLRERVRALLAEGAARYRLWGGADIRPGNVMADAAGQLKLIDPLFIAGKEICAALRDGHTDLLNDFTRDQLADFLSNPFLAPGGVAYASRAEVLGWFSRLYADP